MSLGNLAGFLSEAGQAGQAEELLAEMLGVFADSTNGIGYLLLSRGLWRAAQNRPAGAIPDLAAAASAFERDGDRGGRGRARQALRALREDADISFDHDWAQTHELLPVWLRCLATDQQVAYSVHAWIDTQDWAASGLTLTTTLQHC